jgi:hypothetical protein
MFLLAGEPLEHVFKLRSRSIRVSRITAGSTFRKLSLKGTSIKEGNGARIAYSTIKILFTDGIRRSVGRWIKWAENYGYYIGNKIYLNTGWLLNME